MSKNSKMWLFSAVVAFAFAFNANAGVSGFVDTQVATGQNVTGTPDNSPTFRVGDGAVYFMEKAGSSMVMVDIPFQFSGTGTSNTFSIATRQAQAFVMHGYDFGLSWAIGQFDTGVGIEANDSGNRRWAQKGLIKSVGPSTHTGLLLNYVNGPVDVKAVVANHYSQGLRAADNLDYAAAIRYNHSMFYVSAGYLHHKDAASGNSDMIADFMLGTKQGGFTADAEVGLLKDNTRNTGFNTETGLGLGLWLAYAWNDTCDFAARVEYLNKVLAYSVVQWTAGPSHKFNDKLMARLEYTGTSTTAIQGGTADTQHGGILSTVFKF